MQGGAATHTRSPNQARTSSTEASPTLVCNTGPDPPSPRLIPLPLTASATLSGGAVTVLNVSPLSRSRAATQRTPPHSFHSGMGDKHSRPDLMLSRPETLEIQQPIHTRQPLPKSNKEPRIPSLLQHVPSAGKRPSTPSETDTQTRYCGTLNVDPMLTLHTVCSLCVNARALMSCGKCLALSTV